jgi:hypothetical protein
MTGKRKTAGGKASVKKLKLKRETLKDLDARPKGAKIKGGGVIVYATPVMTICLCITEAPTCGPPCATGNMFCRLK